MASIGTPLAAFCRDAESKGPTKVHFEVNGKAGYVTVPKFAAPGKPWIWRARFPGYHAEMDQELIQEGYHVAYVDVAGLFGGPKAMEIGDAFYSYVRKQFGLSEHCVLEGVSRGGLFVYNWAARHPNRVACIYCDTPVLDFKSWPGGLGNGLGATAEWEQCKKVYGLSDANAKAYSANPVDHASILAKHKIPILHVVSENDVVVPPKENTYVLQGRLQAAGHAMQVISLPEGTEKSHGHHFTHPDPDRVVEFIRTHSGMARRELLRDVKRIIVLGDSITQSGLYVSHFDSWLQTLRRTEAPTVINVGLSSETVSGLSEEGHAGGRFPRPDLAERLERVLKTTKPDLVFACYGINCGIYQPFDEQRFAAYHNGIEHLRSLVAEHDVQIIHITPPTYDDARKSSDFSYNAVLDRYSEWLLSKRRDGWNVVPLHFPMSRELDRRRETDSAFTFQPDAVHPNEAGHWYMASQLIRWFGDVSASECADAEQMRAKAELPHEVFDAIHQRMQVRRNAYLSAAGHKRPGVPAGLPLPEAEAIAEKLTQTVQDWKSK